MLQSIRDSLSLVERAERPLLLALFGVGLLAAVLETGSVGLVYLFLKIAMEPAMLGGIQWAQGLYGWLGMTDKPLFMVSLALGVMAVFVTRVAVQVFSVWFNMWLRKKIQVRVSGALFGRYLSGPYSRYLASKSSTFLNNVTSNSAAAVANCTLGVVEIAGAVALAVLFLLTLFVVRPLETLGGIAVIGTLAAVYWFLMQERLLYWGNRMLRATEEVYAAVAEVDHGIKTIKTTQTEDVFHQRYLNLAEEQYTLRLKSGIAQQLPRFALELVVIVVLFGAVGTAIAVGETMQEIIPAMALFGMATLRMVPAFVRIISALQLYRNSAPCLQAILPDYRECPIKGTALGPRENRPVPLKFERALVLEDISYHYAGANIPAVRNVRIKIEKGQLVGFAGHSGSGKSTTADILLGLLSPTSGRIICDNQAMPSNAVGLFAYVPQDSFVLDDSVRRNVAFGVEEKDIDDARVWDALSGAALADRVRRLPKGVNSVLGERGGSLSGGERQRLGIARALYQDAPILVLDEPTASLDARTEFEVGEAINKLHGSKTVIVIAHRLSFISRCDKIFFFDKGSVVAEGTFKDLVANVPAFREMVDHLRMEAS